MTDKAEDDAFSVKRPARGSQRPAIVARGGVGRPRPAIATGRPAIGTLARNFAGR
jgi:hypothetical protein